MQLKNKIAMLVATSAIIAVSSLTALAGQWQQDARGWVYQNDDGTYAINTWVHDKGVYYFTGTDGLMKVNQWTTYNGNWYFLDGSGAMVYNTQLEIGGKWYSFNPDGSMQRGWIQRDNKWYYYGVDGALCVGLQNIGGQWYYLGGADGSMTTGWVTIGNDKYYFFSDGHMASGVQQIDGVKQFFMPDGRFVPDADTNNGITNDDVTRMSLFNAAYEDMGWDDIESLADKYYTNLYATSNEILEVINGWRDTNKVPRLKLSSSLSKSAFALAISNKAYDFYGADSESTTGIVEYAQAADMFNTNIRGLTMAKESDVSKAVKSLYNKEQLQVICNKDFSAAGVGFIRLDDGNYILILEFN